MMKQYSKVLCVASRGRGNDNAQHFEARTDRCTNTITSVQKDNLILTICRKIMLNEKRYIVSKCRRWQGKLIRRQYKNDIGVPYSLTKGHTLMLDGYSNAITTFCELDNQIMELKYNENMENLVYHEHPTKEQLLEYFSQRIRIRKMTPKTAFRLMDVDDADIDKMMNAEETVTLKNGTKKTKKAISKTACYKLAGNSIVVSCLYHIFRTMFIPGQPENKIKQSIQLSLFD